MTLRHWALASALIPALTVHITWVTAASTQALEWCNPYWSHCHSISATGREVPQFYIFKLFMLPAAVCMAMYWRSLAAWLQSQAMPPRGIFLIRILGYSACLALGIYTLTLGAIGESWQVPRRMGVVGYFAFTAFAHLWVLRIISSSDHAEYIRQSVRQRLFWITTGLWCLGIISAILGFTWSGYNNWDNAFEWWFAALMVSQFVCVAFLPRSQAKAG
ncbi:hypothetical protein [Alteromonas flava]|uniref:hypothetical protein n=1 Tax=Alteromonas flava TaxID=2048003 RepID=UPI000C2877B8|nr:hypothetical protein [Alteromonas flava]